MQSLRIAVNTIRGLFPTRAIALLMFIGFLDLAVTASLHAEGKIVELNPLMRFFIERSELLFVLVKSATLALAWVAMIAYCRVNLAFVRIAATVGSGLYVCVWTVWFVFGKP